MSTVRKVDYFTVDTPNKPGEALKFLTALRDAGVNLLAFTGFPSGRRAQMDFFPEDTRKFNAAVKKAGFVMSEKKTGFLLQGEDQPGALLEVLEKLAEGGINITAMDAVASGDGRYGAIFWVKPPDVARTSKLLGLASPRTRAKPAD